MVKIKNTNDRFGATVTFESSTLDEAVQLMQAHVRECGPELSDVIITSSDYEIESDDYLLEQLCSASHRDDAGPHFTTWLDWQALEEAGLIVIDRPVHVATGISYGQEEWTFAITEAGLELLGSR